MERIPVLMPFPLSVVGSVCALGKDAPLFGHTAHPGEVNTPEVVSRLGCMSYHQRGAVDHKNVPSWIPTFAVESVPRGDLELPVKIYCDDKSAKMLFETLKTNHRVKHINVRIQSIRELITQGIFAIHFVPTAHNVADILTKALPVTQFKFLRNILMLGHGGQEPACSPGPEPRAYQRSLPRDAAHDPERTLE
eukprot:gene47527-biopygen36851